MSNHQEMTKVKNNHSGPGDSHRVERAEQSSLAMSATIHCLLGCGLGEVAGIV